MAGVVGTYPVSDATTLLGFVGLLCAVDEGLLLALETKKGKGETEVNSVAELLGDAVSEAVTAVPGVGVGSGADVSIEDCFCDMNVVAAMMVRVSVIVSVSVFVLAVVL